MRNYGLIEKIKKINNTCPLCNNKQLKYDSFTDEDDFTIVTVSCNCGYETNYDDELNEITIIEEDIYSCDEFLDDDYDDFFDIDLTNKIDVLTDKYDCCPFCGGTPLKFFKHKKGNIEDSWKQSILDFMKDNEYYNDDYEEINVCKCECGWFAFFVDDNEEINDIY